MRILAVSDTVISSLYHPKLLEVFGRIDLVISCGDLPYAYVEYLVSKLDVPTFYVRGNHCAQPGPNDTGQLSEPQGATDLHRRLARQNGVLFAGVEGSLRYRPGPFQYSQNEMWLHVWSLVPGMLWNRRRYGRYVDIFVTHAPSAGIHDQPDLPHQGIRAFRWLVSTFKPRYHIHGHIHTYRPDTIMETQVGPTTVLNAYGYRFIQWELTT